MGPQSKLVVGAWTAIGIGAANGVSNGAMAISVATGAVLGIVVGLLIWWRRLSA